MSAIGGAMEDMGADGCLRRLGVTFNGFTFNFTVR